MCIKHFFFNLSGNSKKVVSNLWRAMDYSKVSGISVWSEYTTGDLTPSLTLIPEPSPVVGFYCVGINAGPGITVLILFVVTRISVNDFLSFRVDVVATHRITGVTMLQSYLEHLRSSQTFSTTQDMSRTTSCRCIVVV